jgi:hypothetical protein
MSMTRSHGWQRRTGWFAAQFLVVVSGVLVALMLQSWHENRRDAARELAYLRQLGAELRATEALMDRGDSVTAEADYANARLVRAYRERTPPRDSVLIWLVQIGRWFETAPVTGTAEALVVSGDLGLIRSDSLRAAIASYVARNRNYVDLMTRTIEFWQRERMALGAIADLTEARLLVGGDGTMSGVYGEARYTPVPEKPLNGVFPIDTHALLRDRTAYQALDRMNWAKFVMRLTRDNIRSAARELSELIDAELGER